MKRLTKQDLNQLPQEVQDKVMNTLKAYDEVSIIYEYGKYNVSTGTCIKKTYGADHKVIGTVNANDVYTKEERYKNFEETFGYMPRVKIFG